MLSDLIDVELLQQVQVGSLAAQIALGHALHALLLQNIHHVIEGVLIGQRRQRLTHTTTLFPTKKTFLE